MVPNLLVLVKTWRYLQTIDSTKDKTHILGQGCSLTFDSPNASHFGKTRERMDREEDLQEGSLTPCSYIWGTTLPMKSWWILFWLQWSWTHSLALDMPPLEQCCPPSSSPLKLITFSKALSRVICGNSQMMRPESGVWKMDRKMKTGISLSDSCVGMVRTMCSWKGTKWRRQRRWWWTSGGTSPPSTLSCRH